MESLPEDRKFVLAIARRFMRNDQDAEDVAQEALLLAYRHRDRFRGDAGYRTWLYRIATTAALSALRRRRAARRRVDALADQIASGVGLYGGLASPDVLLDRARAQAELARELDALDEKYREVIALRVETDATEREIADELALSLPTVKIRCFRARQMLRERLRHDDGDRHGRRIAAG